jgi:FAD:protein FMN transferase
MQEYNYSTRGMGTEIDITLVCDDEATADLLYGASAERLRSAEAQFSRFIPESELSRLNRSRSLIVTPRFLEILERGILLAQKTGGHFNPLLQVSRLGYTHSFDTLMERALIFDRTSYNKDINALRINTETREVTLIEDQKLDMGGYLKGLLAAEEADRLMHDGGSAVRGVIVNIGGDLASRGSDGEQNPFLFTIDNPITETTTSVVLTDASLATSGTYRRSWRTTDSSFHHILAENGLDNPTTDVVSASVVHTDGATADAYAKALLALGKDGLEAIVHEPVRGVLITTSGEVTAFL